MDFDGFDFSNDGFPSTTYNHQQHQQRYVTTAAPTATFNAPTAEGYDPRGGSSSSGGASSQQQQYGLHYHHHQHHHHNGTAAASATTATNTNQYNANIGLLGASIDLTPMNPSRHHHSPLMPPHGSIGRNNSYHQTQNHHAGVGVGAVGGASSSSTNSSTARYQHQQHHGSNGHTNSHLQLLQQQQQQQQQQRLQQHASALSLPAPIAGPAATYDNRQHLHRQQQQQSRRRRSDQQQQQQQQQQYSTAIVTTSSAKTSSNYNNINHNNGSMERRTMQPINSEPWMEAIQLTITNLSTTPMSGTVVIQLLQRRADEVLTRYLPCVEFLVQCQQDLRRGLQEATTKRVYHNMLRDKLTPHQFYSQYIARLPEIFQQKNRGIMSAENLKEAVAEMQKLCDNAKNAQRQGCENVKNTFLGGMKDGESWGLRKWLSKHGGALMICNDSECILHAVQKLDRSDDATIKLARTMRPVAKASLTRLTKDVPTSYQEQSSAHPFLPFFHRLEAALRGLSNFDPEDDDVICIDDDDEVEVLKAVPPKPGPKERKSTLEDALNNSMAAKKRKLVDITIDDDGDGDDDDNQHNGSQKMSGSRKSSKQSRDSDSSKKFSYQPTHKSPDSKLPTNKRSRKTPGGGSTSVLNDNDLIGIEATVNGLIGNPTGNEADSDYMKALLRTLNDEIDDDDDVMNINFDEIDRRTSLLEGPGNVQGLFDLSSSLDRVVFYFESNQQDLVRPMSPHWSANDSFWDQAGPYAGILRTFSALLKEQDSIHLLTDPADEHASQQYLSIVKHPLCFRDIVVALVAHFDATEMTVLGNPGSLQVKTLSSWNMWRGNDLVMAIDLVFLNTLAYDKAREGSKTSIRSRVNKLRKTLWTGVRDIIESYSPASDAETKKKLQPTRRSEGSSFVVHKT